jgi:carbon monoxide dehydrogenase subunit G
LEIDNTFEVPVPVPEAWALLMDIERIVPCVPGAELTETVDDRTYKGKIAVRLGPVNLSFTGQAHFEEMDDTAHIALIKAQGTDSRGRGGAQANVTFSMEEAEDGTKVLIHTDLQLSGAVAQYGRGAGMVADLAQHLIDQFADCLKTRIIVPAAGGETAAAAAEAPSAPPEQAAPVQVGGLGLRVLWNAILRGLKRLFGGG